QNFIEVTNVKSPQITYSMHEVKYNCAGMARRDFIQVGLRTAMGLGFADLLRLRASGAAPKGKVSPQQVNCIMIWLDGGPSHYETFDPKPDAPKEIRGELSAIPTALPGVRFCETVPNLAKIADRVTIIRSICHKDPNHGG